MNSILEPPWRAYPAGAVLAAGLSLFLWGTYVAVKGYVVSARERLTPIAFASGLRSGLVGFAIALLGVAWMWQQLWLLVRGLAVGGEELLETTVALFALRRSGRALRRRSLAHDAR